MKTNESLKSRVQEYIKTHPNTKLSKVVQQFVAVGGSRASVYRWAGSALQTSKKAGRLVAVGRPELHPKTTSKS